MAMKGFMVMLTAEGVDGACVLTYGIAASNKDEAGRLAEAAAGADGFWEIALDEVWRPDDVDDEALGDIPGVIGRGEPVYADEDGPGFSFGDDDEDEDEPGEDAPDDEDWN